MFGLEPVTAHGVRTLMVRRHISQALVRSSCRPEDSAMAARLPAQIASDGTFTFVNVPSDRCARRADDGERHTLGLSMF